MPRYKAELYCHIVAFTDLIVEAESPEQAKEIALADAKQLPPDYWTLETVEDIDLNTLGLPVEVTEEDAQ